MGTLSVCIVTKNCEELLKNCLESLKGLYQELVILDLGSTDKTTEVAKKYTERVYHYSLGMKVADSWNEVLQHATMDWVLFVHPHEMLRTDSQSLIQELIEDGPDAYSCRIRHYTNNSNMEAWRKVQSDFPFSGYVDTHDIRLFKNHRNFQFKGSVVPSVVESLEHAKIKNSSFLIHQFSEWKNQKISISSIPQDDETLVALGIQAQKQDDLTAAIAYYEKALKLGDNVNAAINLSFCHLQQRQLRTAFVVLEKALAKHPRNVSLMNNLTTYYVYNNEVEKAMDQCERVLKIDAGNFSGYMNLGYCHVVKKDFVEAIKLYKQAVALNPKSSEARLNLSLAFLKNSERDNAKLALEGLLELNPRHEGAKELMSKLA